MKGFLTALQFLTLFRVKRDLEVTKESLASSMAYFPLVGALQGVILALVDYLLAGTGLLPESLTAGALILILALTNGGLHLDGFADTVDGIAGGKTPEERLRIMRDKAVGPIGASFLFLVLLLKFLAIEELPIEARARAIFLFPAAGRWAMVLMAHLSPSARAEGLGAAFSSNSRKVLVISTLIMATLSVLALGALSLVIIIALGGIVYAFTRFFKKRLGGVTGDVFGFQSEVAEVSFLALALAFMNILALAE